MVELLVYLRQSASSHSTHEVTRISDIVEQRVIPGSSNDERLTHGGTNEVVPTSVSLSLHLYPG